MKRPSQSAGRSVGRLRLFGGRVAHPSAELVFPRTDMCGQSVQVERITETNCRHGNRRGDAGLALAVAGCPGVEPTGVRSIFSQDGAGTESSVASLC